MNEMRPLQWAIAASLAAHALVLLARPSEPPKRPHYIVLETRLEMPGAPGAGRLMTATRTDALPTAQAAGSQRRQSATPFKEGERIASSPLTLPHAFKQEQLFEPGQHLAERNAQPGIPAIAPPDPATYFRASELDAVAAPRFAANLDLDFLRFLDRGVDSLRVRVFINEAGMVDDVRLDGVDEPPVAVLEQVRAAFLALRFFPALKDGFVVKSQKLVEVGAAADEPS